MTARKLVAAILVLSAALAVTACGSSSSKKTSSKPKTHQPRGKLIVSYEKPADSAAAQAQQLLKLGGVDGIAAGFTKNFKLPHDIHIVGRNGQDSPNYDPAKRTLTLYYGFVDFTAGIIRQQNPHQSDYEFGKELAAVDDFIFIHELGHMFVDQFNLPVLGKEEDAVDALAAVFMTKFVSHGDEYAFDAADFFNGLQHLTGPPSESSYFDEHSLDAQRAYEIICWIAGSNQKDYGIILKAGLLPASRLQRCPTEYQQKVRSWLTLLRPHFA